MTEQFNNLIKSLNGKTLRNILCTYCDLDTNADPFWLDEECLESIACDFGNISTEYVLEIIAANWYKVCSVNVLTEHGNAGCPEVEIKFAGFSKQWNFTLDWLDE